MLRHGSLLKLSFYVCPPPPLGFLIAANIYNKAKKSTLRQQFESISNVAPGEIIIFPAVTAIAIML